MRYLTLLPALLFLLQTTSTAQNFEAGNAVKVSYQSSPLYPTSFLNDISSAEDIKPGEIGIIKKVKNNIRGRVYKVEVLESGDTGWTKARNFDTPSKSEVEDAKASSILRKKFSDLIKPRGEFETLEEYQIRRKRAKKKRKEILNNLRYKRKQMILQSTTSVKLSVQKVGRYKANDKLLPLTIKGKTYEADIPINEARSFKKNWNEANVVGYKQLGDDMNEYRYINLKVIHPISGSRYPIGPQKNLSLDKDKPNKIDPERLPETTASATFEEPSGNQKLDGGETATVTITVTNDGMGPARFVQARVKSENHPHLTYPNSIAFGTIGADSSVSESIQIHADRDVSAGPISLSFDFEEAKGFAPSPIRLQFETSQFAPPKLTIADVGINDASGNGVIETGEVVDVTARVRNTGRGRAEDVTANIKFGENVFGTPETQQSFKLGTVDPGAFQDIRFTLVTNQQADSVPVTIDLSEKYGEYGKQDVKLPLAFNRPTDQITDVQVEGQDTEVAVQSGDALSVDVETNIPTTSMDRPDAVAVVMGIRSYASEGVPEVEYARRDARVMRQYLTQTLGFHEGNILPRNPDGRMTYAEMRTLVQQKLPSYVKDGTSEVFIFYSGHGAPTTGDDRQGYLVPSDTDPNFVSDANAYALRNFYTDLSEVGASSVTVVLDACFTGQAGSGEMMIRQASPSVLSVENPFLAIENGTAFLASSTEQVANWYPEKKHGMFTYFFLKGLKGAANQDGDQTLTVAEMKAYLTDADNGVPYYSRRVHQRKQTPQVVAQDESRVLVRYEK